MVVDVLGQLHTKDVIVAYDNDEHLDSTGRLIRPGPFGAERLIVLSVGSRFVPPTKDLRSFLTSGGISGSFCSPPSTLPSARGKNNVVSMEVDFNDSNFFGKTLFLTFSGHLSTNALHVTNNRMLEEFPEEGERTD
jgi:hypothetical protein